MLGLSRYQWTVLFAAWLGWGFDLFDFILFNYVAPNCVPTLLNLTIGSPEAKAATFYWTGVMTSVLLLGWAIGGVMFGKLADRIGRTKTLLLTILIYSLGTASCAFAPNIWILMLCRFLASLGIGGEWAAGVTMVAEVMPEKRRVEAAALLCTAAPAGHFLATCVNFAIAGMLLPQSPEVSWRYIFMCGLIPAVVAAIVRLFVKEPEVWLKNAGKIAPPRIRELFNPENLPATISGLLLAITAIVTGSICGSFIPVVAAGLAQSVALERSLDATATQVLIEQWKTIASNCLTLGSLIGTLLTAVVAKLLGRKIMFSLYFFLSSAAILIIFGLSIPPEVQLYLFFFIGLSVFGIFGSFSYYLPELFPTRLRATGSGFCYNAGRVVAAAGPFLVGYLASQESSFSSASVTLFWVGFLPLLGLAAIPWTIETKGQVLAD
ncbi:MFS transporter [Aerosakkonema funiforme]|uniref:MFS transporter n=2 Tax=Oscillatoriophycideae TaxID=1301283 RepID=A0A926ZJL4_9CYAN|nr:MFS transporter [Aerosakkonema funiforme]MBD2183006.1 MFS transporter [Aerosakkonema funiforme FACHB-1375]